MNMKPLRCGWRFLIFALLILIRPPAGDAASVPPNERVLILVSLDAFRWDYLKTYPAPNLNRLAAEGVHARKLIPMFPTMTFPNHHTIVTGLRPARHGIIHNNFYDPTTKAAFAFNKAEQQGPEWWGGEPVWATAIKQGRRASVALWPGTGIKMSGLLPTEWKSFEYAFEPDAIVDLGLKWLDQPGEKRPGLVMLYFHQVDSVGHKRGPDSPETAAAVAQVDAAMGRLMDGLIRMKLEAAANVIVVSDHGMADISAARTVLLGDLVDLKTVQVDFSGALAGLRPADGNVDGLFQSIKAKEKHFKTYRAENMPGEYHFTNNARIPPIVLVADDGWYLSKRDAAEPAKKEMNKATHGFDPRLDSMGATFIAWGPAFQRGVKLDPMENVHLYNLFCATLGLKPAANDGDDRIVKRVLVK